MKLLLVEDEARMVRMLTQGLAEEGHQVDACATGRAALEQAFAIAYDAILLDWSLPDLDGLSVLREWRERGLRTPVLMLTARGSTGEKVTGLKAGADDYLVKPFAFEELLARIEALHRRGAGEAAGAIGPVRVDPRRRALIHGDRVEPLSGREYALLSELLRARGDVLSRTRLLQSVWGGELAANQNVVDVYVGYLRTKLARVGATGTEIQAVRGVGYRLVIAEPG